jgi:very-short-patch-repair endonuclease
LQEEAGSRFEDEQSAHATKDIVADHLRSMGVDFEKNVSLSPHLDYILPYCVVSAKLSIEIDTETISIEKARVVMRFLSENGWTILRINGSLLSSSSVNLSESIARGLNISGIHSVGPSLPLWDALKQDY